MTKLIENMLNIFIVGIAVVDVGVVIVIAGSMTHRLDFNTFDTH